MRLSHIGLVLLIAIGLLACGDPGTPVTQGGDIPAVAELAAQDSAAADLAPAELPLELDGTQQELPAEDTCDQCDQPECGDGSCFMDPCSQNADCLSGMCVDHMGDLVCTQFCVEECPAGWTCTQVGTGGTDLVFACVSPFSRLCRPCAEDGDCVSVDGAENRCVTYDDEGSFCGVTCGGGKLCPDGYNCQEVLTRDGTAVSSCVNVLGTCPCTDTSIALALSTPCGQDNEFGACSGMRVCTELGLSACDAKTPAPEDCNGLDDNCDGSADEGTCDDEDLCTEDACDPAAGCQHLPLTDVPCNDGDSCTFSDTCQAGSCLGDIIVCDDGNPCTDDVCDPITGCTFPHNGGPCDDGNPCTFADTCAKGVCTSGVSLDCDDGNPCTTDQCDDLEGCLHIPSAGPCDDGNECTAGESCVAGECLPTQPAQCDDGNPCTDDWCEPTGGCINTPNNASCSDDDLCTLGDECQNGECSGGQPLACDDKNPCTNDSCNKLLGCVHSNSSEQCDDSDPCSLVDQCVGGTCVGTGAIDCDDGNPCTMDFCDPMIGCSHDPNTNPCDDSNPCTTKDTCKLGTCAGGPQPDCDDGNPCTDDLCIAQSGCIHSANAQSCDDNNECTTDDHCQDGVCLSHQSVPCDDGNPCTKDICLPDGGCTAEPTVAPCSDGNPCTVNDACEDGLCIPGQEVICDDGNDCTTDSCQDGLCVFDPQDGACDDGNPCTPTDVCALGHCKGTGTPDCDDENLCTTDFCDPASACVYVLNNLPCNDDDVCTTADVCSNGQCTGSSPLVCDDGNICTQDDCDQAKGCTFSPIIDLPCTDGNVCTTGDICNGGACVTNGFLDCEDDNPCTQDSCDPDAGCVNLPTAGSCTDNDVCTEDDSCLNGQCIPGPAVNCDDGNICTDDSCEPQTGCAYSIQDGDQDGIANVCDNCPLVPNGDQANSDADTLGNQCDNCPNHANQDQANGDGDQVGNECDNCPADSNQDQADGDGDGVGTVCDNCPAVSNPDQLDSDDDGQGDACSNNCPGGLWIKVEGHEDICVNCNKGDHSCQAKGVCEGLTNLQCEHQGYDCCWGNKGSWYPLDGSSGSSNFAIAYAYDFGNGCGGGDYGNICACDESKPALYGFADNHEYCGVGHWFRQ